MRSYNKTLLLGNLAAKPEFRKTVKDNDIATFPLAINRQFTNQETGEKTQEVDYHRIVCFGPLAKIVEQNLDKGSSILVDGRLNNRFYENQKGEKIYTTEIVAEDINILNWKKTNNPITIEKTSNTT